MRIDDNLLKKLSTLKYLIAHYQEQWKSLMHIKLSSNILSKWKVHIKCLVILVKHHSINK